VERFTIHLYEENQGGEEIAQVRYGTRHLSIFGIQRKRSKLATIKCTSSNEVHSRHRNFHEIFKHQFPPPPQSSLMDGDTVKF
jgi:hypothetical protein